MSNALRFYTKEVIDFIENQFEYYGVREVSQLTEEDQDIFCALLADVEDDAVIDPIINADNLDSFLYFIKKSLQDPKFDKSLVSNTKKIIRVYHLDTMQDLIDQYLRQHELQTQFYRAYDDRDQA